MKYKRDLQNLEATQPYIQAMNFVELLLVEAKWTREELLASIDDLKSYEHQEFVSKFFSQGVFIEMIVFGNISKDVNFN